MLPINCVSLNYLLKIRLPNTYPSQGRPQVSPTRPGAWATPLTGATKEKEKIIIYRKEKKKI